MMHNELAPEYVEARRVLLDALTALEDHSESIIVAGAQAVYLRTGSSELLRGLQPYTTDADLALDPSSLRNQPALEGVMASAGFTLQLAVGGAEEPGIWVPADTPDSLATVDLIVPDGLADPTGRRGARLGPHGKRAARKIKGLEAAVVDRTLEQVTALDPRDDRRVEAKVAGTAALLVAKMHKIQDRVGDRNRLTDKDAADVYRLMGSVAPGDLVPDIRRLLEDPRAADVTREATAVLRDLFGRRGAPGIVMGTRALEGVVPAETVTATFTGFVSALLEEL